jgi:acyl-CoA reductase-like NAD-dependent aldehyde dehydrogenase
MFANNPAIQIHGPGYSKILVGNDEIDHWPEFLDIMVSSILDNGGRSCINASAIVVPKYGDEIAEELARRLGPILPAKPEDGSARLSAFASSKMADYIDSAIQEGLQTPGAVDVTAKYRSGPRRVKFDGGVYLCPTVVKCESFDHPLANREFLFPYASVVELPQVEMLRRIGPSLAVTAITHDRKFVEELLESSGIERLNLGRVPTMKVSWDQPHEGNMFEFLYRRRAVEKSEGFSV